VGIQIQGNSGVVQEVAGTAFRAANIHVKPIEHGVLGHYRIALRINSTAAQAANSRIFEIRNSHATNLIVPTRLTLKALQTVAGTAQENSLDIFKVTSFTVLDTVNAVAPTVSYKRNNMTTVPLSAQVRHLTLTGAAAGMTGGTLTKDVSMMSTMPYNVAAAVGASVWGPHDVFDDVNGTHPFVLAQNEGMIIENRVLNVTSYGITWYLDVSWAEVTAY
jgi:hypothetical protein